MKQKGEELFSIITSSCIEVFREQFFSRKSFVVSEVVVSEERRRCSIEHPRQK